MKINLYSLLAIAILACSISSCSRADSTTNRVEVKFEDKKNAKANEVVFNETASEFKQQPVSTFGETPKANNYIAKDGSTVKISFDSYGNKIETRYFYNHPNLKLLIVTITPDGNKDGVVFGHNNEHKNLTNELFDRALNATGDEIANAVGIRTTKIEYSKQPTFVQNKQPIQVNPTLPNPNGQEPVNPQPSPITPEAATQPADPQPVKKATPNPNIANESKSNESDNKNPLK